MQSLHRVFLPLAAVLLSGCALIPLSDPEADRNPQDPQFDADYYAQNAKEYFEGEQYLRAREQWAQQLKLQPDNWMAKVGMAQCDFYVGDLALDRGELRNARERLLAAHKAATACWDGTVESDAVKASNIPVAQWKAALCVALSLRGLADCDALNARIEQQRSAALAPHDPARTASAVAAQRLENSAAKQRTDALALFTRLDAMVNPTPDATLNVADLQVQTGAAVAGESSFRRWLGVSVSAREFWNQQLKLCDEERDTRTRDARRTIVQQKLNSVSNKRAAVLVRLGNIAYDQGEVLLGNARGLQAEQRASIEREAKQHFSKAVDDLNSALETEPTRKDVLVKLAQCQGKLGQYELAANNLDKYIRTRSEQADPWDENLNAAFRLKAEFATHLKKPPQ
ncbi:MAG: hypothetical protein EXS14_05440 [Planctomycetes bacterium]|nr:hypothetical protein [Planctomycetota bacterium]